METLKQAANLAIGLIQALFFGALAVNTIGVILFCAGVGLCLGGLFLLGIPVGLIGMYAVIKTDDII